ncbi:MAG: DNA polymerase III subunit chi [Sulfuricaulis sp.]
MTRVDFYILDHTTQGGKDTAVCRLTHKAFRLGHRVYILTADNDCAQRLDRLLWTFSADSFIPHGLGQSPEKTDLPVLIGHVDPPPAHEDVLIQLALKVPECFSRFQRVAELVEDGDNAKSQARERFRFYRDRGYTLQTHNLALETGGA